MHLSQIQALQEVDAYLNYSAVDDMNRIDCYCFEMGQEEHRSPSEVDEKAPQIDQQMLSLHHKVDCHHPDVC